MKTKTGLALLAAGTLLALATAPANAFTISFGFSPVNQTVPLGSNPQVNLIATLGANTDLGGYDLILNYDPSIVTLLSVAWGSGLGSPTIDYLAEATPGAVALSQLSLANPLPSQPTSFTLATLTFSADALGTSPLDLSLPSLATGGPSYPTTGLAQPIKDVVLQDGSITVTDRQVPEGGNLAIVALPTLIGLLLLAKRAQRAKP